MIRKNKICIGINYGVDLGGVCLAANIKMDKNEKQANGRRKYVEF